MIKKRRYIRYLILLSILFAVAAHEAVVKAKIASWEQTLVVRLFAINGDGRSATDKYIKSLNLTTFKSVERFINRQARHYDIPIDVIKVSYAGELKSKPPEVPKENNR